MKMSDILVDGSSVLISLEKVHGKAVKDIHGYITTEFGDPTFQISRVVFEDGTFVFAEGEHDLPYLTGVDVDQVEDNNNE